MAINLYDLLAESGRMEKDMKKASFSYWLVTLDGNTPSQNLETVINWIRNEFSNQHNVTCFVKAQ